MTRTIGWWDYDETDRPTLVNRDSGECLRMGDSIEIAGKADSDGWRRFDYLHDDLTFPLVIFWKPEDGRIVVDYPASAALWRQETDTAQSHPPYGTWVRVDDCVIDAIWSWPGNFEKMQRAYDNPIISKWIGRIGGWFNAAWHPELLRVDFDTLGTMSPYPREGFRQYPLEKLIALDEPPPSPWYFVGVDDPEQYCANGFDRWNGELLFGEESEQQQERYYGNPDRYQSGGRRAVEIRGMVPQLRSRNGARLLFPREAHIVRTPYCDPEDSFLFELVTDSFGDYRVEYRLPASWRPDTDEVEVWPRYTILGHDGRIRNPAQERFVEYVDRRVDCANSPARRLFRILSMTAMRAQARLVADAFLAWEGTRKAPELWGSNHGPYLTYEKPDFICATESFVGGQVYPEIKSFAAFGMQDLWRSRGIDIAQFIRDDP